MISTYINLIMEILVLCISVLFLLSTFIFLKTRSQKSNGKFPPGPWKLPFIGNIHNLKGAVVISSADAAKQVMKTHDLNFASRPPITAAEIIGYACTSITFSPYSEYWRQLRKICTLELLSAKRVESFRSLREEVFVDLSRRFASMEGSEINFSEELSSATYAVTARAAIGDEKKQHVALLPNMKEVVNLSAGFDISEFFPSIKLFKLVSRLRRRLMVLHKEIDGILENVIHQHRIANSVNHEDLLDVLLKYHQDELTIDNIKSVILDMIGAGSDTSSTLMEWAMSELLKNPRILERAQQEVRKVFDEEGYVNESRIPQLKYLKSVVKETLRMHPPVPLLLPRLCGKTCEIDGYEIPAETKIIVNAWAVNRDPKYWEDPDCFQPERFMHNLIDYKGSHFEYIPFGAGRRICPGITFGMANVELPLAMFLYHFDWKLGDGMKHQDIDMEEVFGATARRSKQLCIVPSIGRPLPTK